ncbi:unnamed protein product, partial [Closterium sp. NIES-54]
LPESLAPLPCSPALPCTPCVEGLQRAAPHSSSFPPTMNPFQTLHLDVRGPSPVLGPREERYFLIVVDDYSRYTTVFPLRRKSDVPTALKSWLLARGGAQGLCGLHLHSDRGGEFSSTRVETFCQGRGIIQSYTLPNAPQQNGVAERRIGLVMEVARTSMCHASAPQFLWPQAVRYVAHKLNLWPSVARPGVTPVSLWTGSPGVAADFRFFSSQVVTFDEYVCYYGSRPHPGVSHVTPRSSPPQRPVTVMSGGAGGAVAEGEGTGAAGACGVGSGGAGGVAMEVTPVEDTAASTRRPRPTSPLGFPSVPQFPPHSSLRPVAAEPGGVPAGGIGGTWGVDGGAAGSGGTGAGGSGTVAPTPRSRVEEEPQPQQERVEEESQPQQERAEEGSRLQQQVQLHPQQERVEESQLQQQVQLQSQRERVEQESRPQQNVHFHPQQERVEEESWSQQESLAQESWSQKEAQLQPQQERAEEEPQEQQQGQVPSKQTPEEAEQQRQRDLPDPAPVRLVRGPLPSPPVPPVESLSSSPWTPRSPLGRAVSPKPCWSHYRADGPFHLVLRSRVPPPPILPQPPESSLTVFHNPLSDYLRAPRPVVSRVLFELVTHPSAPLLSVSALVTTFAGFASSHRLDYTAHQVSGTTCSPSSEVAPIFPLKVLEDRQFEVGFLAGCCSSSLRHTACPLGGSRRPWHPNPSHSRRGGLGTLGFILDSSRGGKDGIL